jgi:hypothetical protein
MLGRYGFSKSDRLLAINSHEFRYGAPIYPNLTAFAQLNGLKEQNQDEWMPQFSRASTEQFSHTPSMILRLIISLLLSAAFVTVQAGDPTRPFPSVDELPEIRELPNPFVFLV